ncbi:MAG: hypothetical protein QM770_10310 [Tepidisphaeraceae bacterium]
MSAGTEQALQAELELLDNFAELYRPKFEAAIRDLNRSPHDTPIDGTRTLRLCVEAMGMILMTQQRLAQALREPALKAAA